MQSSASLRDFLTNLLLLDQPQILGCRVLRATSPDGKETSISDLRKQLRYAEVEAIKLDLSCFLPPSPLLELWLFSNNHEELKQISYKLCQRHGLVEVESLVSAFAPRELLNENHNDLYEAYKCSTLAKVGRHMSSSQEFLMLNPRTFARYAPSEQGDFISIDAFRADSASALDIQIMEESSVLGFRPVPSCNWTTTRRMLHSRGHAEPSAMSDVLIAPCGRMARYKGIHQEITTRHNNSDADRKDEAKQLMWKDSVTTWLSNRGVSFPHQDPWVDVDIVITPDALPSLKPDHDRDMRMLRSIIWPSSLVLSRRKEVSPQPEPLIDPKNHLGALEAAEDWLRTSNDRANKVGKRKVAKVAEQVQRERAAAERASQDEVSIASPAVARPYTELHAAAAIYPTPPDGPLSHVTPGMSSIDAGVTPHYAPDNAGIVTNENAGEDVDMLDTNDNPVRDFLGDDLFDDDPIANSESGDIDNEIDWDFFDEPGAESKPRAVDHTQTEDAIPPNVKPDVIDMAASSSKWEQSLHEHSLITPALQEQADKDNRTDTNTSASIDKPNPPAASPEVASNQLFQDSKVNPPEKSKESHFATPKLPLNRRRSSRSETSSAGECESQDEKYTKESGRYWFDQSTYLHPKEKQAYASHQESSLPRSSIDIDVDENSYSEAATPMSSVSDESDSDNQQSTNVSSNDIWSIFKRKWAKDTDRTVLQSATVDDSDRRDIEHEHFALLDHLFNDFGQWSLEDTLAVREPSKAYSRRIEEDQMQLAQLLFDLTTQSFSLQATLCSPPDVSDNTSLLASVAECLEEAFGQTTRPSLGQLAQASIGDVSNIGDMQYETPRIRVKRGEKDLEASPLLLPFWETFGIQPISGKKDITAFCIHPSSPSIGDSCRDFMAQLSHVYQGCNLGQHRLGSSLANTEDGFIQWGPDSDSYKNLLIKCKEIGKRIANLPLASTAVVYVVCPDSRPEALVTVCESLLDLFKSYATSPQEQSKTLPEIVPQLIPLSMIATIDTIILPSQKDLLWTALEIYNRCPAEKKSTAYPASIEPAALLNDSGSKAITFSLSASKAMPTQSQSGTLHLAYAITKDERWVAATWTDSCGSRSLTMPYCLQSEPGEPLQSRQLLDVIKEMWEISLDILTPLPSPGRLIVCRIGHMSHAEMSAWMLYYLQSSSSVPASSRTRLILLTADHSPRFRLTRPSTTQAPLRQRVTQQPGSQNTPTSASFPFPSNNSINYGTPVSTPTPSGYQSVLSPEQTATGGTPGGVSSMTPTPSGTTGSQQVAAPSPAANGARQASTQQHSSQGSQTPAALPVVTQTQQEIQAVLESDPSAYLTSPGYGYFGISSPLRLSRSDALLDKRQALASVYLLRSRLEGGSTMASSTLDDGPETVLGVSLIWMSASVSSSPRITATRTTKADADDSDIATDAALSAATSPAKSSVGADAHATSQRYNNFLLHELLPLYRDLIVLSESRGLGHVSSAMGRERLLSEQSKLNLGSGRDGSHAAQHVLPWHIMTALRGKRVFEQAGL